jgi:5'(3')-deoxyribonucleotidase
LPQNNNTLLFLDMDGVLVDFVSGALGALGRTDLKDTDVTQPDMAQQLQISSEDFWGAQNRDPDFWLNLKPYEGAVEFYEALSRMATVYICSSPSLHVNCASHKLIWLQRYLGHAAASRFFLCREKRLLSCLGRILIDDNDKQVDGWGAEAGWTFLLPRTWNSKRPRFVSTAQSYDDALWYVRSMTQ